jgi:hypothetical protein
MGGACSNCCYAHGYSRNSCNRRRQAQLQLIPTLKSGRDTAPRRAPSKPKSGLNAEEKKIVLPLSRKSQTKKVSHSFDSPDQKVRTLQSFGFTETKSSGNDQTLAEGPQKPTKLIIAPQFVKTINILGSSLPAPVQSNVSPQTQELFNQCRSELDKLHSRDMCKLKKPITDLDEAFESFKTQEKGYGVDYLVKPSGSLKSKLLHLLNQPSFTTAKDRLENCEPADECNPSTQMIMDNAFHKGDTMMIDYVHRRSTSCEDIQREEALLDRHESFSNALLASSEAKVILAYGTKVQNRLLRRR